MSVVIRKWWALFSIYAQEGFAYRANGVIWILTDTIPAMIMPLVFIASAKTGGTVGGFTSQQFVLYYLVMLLVTNFITCHLMWELAMEIKEGVFTTNLLRPVSYFQVCFIRNLTWRLLRMMYFIPIFALLIWLYSGHLGGAKVYGGIEAIASVILGHMVSFSLAYMLTMFALMLQETRSVFELYYFPMLFLSGQLFPIYLMPSWIVSVSKALPFYYTTAFPVDIIIGKASGAAAHQGLMLQAVWIGVHLVAARFLWRAGLKHYTAVGM